MSFVMASTAELPVLRRVMEDFPTFASVICDFPVNDTVRREYELNQMDRLTPGSDSLWINGLELDTTQLDPFRYDKK